jgi:outer membrane protein assembly factor BamE
MKKGLILFALAAASQTTGCGYVMNNLPGVYTIDIRQGNMIDQVMIDQLRPGMNKRQVLYIMGSPMVSDMFHDQRWDYIFSEQKSGEERFQKRITLFFSGDNLMGVQGDLKPSNLPVVKPSQETTVDLPKRVLDRSMWEKISGLFSREEEKAEEKAAEEKKDKTTEEETSPDLFKGF